MCTNGYHWKLLKHCLYLEHAKTSGKHPSFCPATLKQLTILTINHDRMFPFGDTLTV